MDKPIGTFFTVIVVVALLVAVGPGAVSAAPARPNRGEGCLVQDTDFNEYLDPDCDFQEVFKYDKEGNVVALVHYQDHGHLPIGSLTRPCSSSCISTASVSMMATTRSRWRRMGHTIPMDLSIHGNPLLCEAIRSI
jgi:hypothetical protein